MNQEREARFGSQSVLKSNLALTSHRQSPKFLYKACVSVAWTTIKRTYFFWNSTQKIGVCRAHSYRNQKDVLQAFKDAAERDYLFDLALFDLQMPEMDGMTLARAIKAEPGFASIPLVLLTSIGQRGEASAARDAGFAAYLTKPLRKSQL